MPSVEIGNIYCSDEISTFSQGFVVIFYLCDIYFFNIHTRYSGTLVSITYSVSQKKVAPLKHFAIFSLVVNLCN